MESLLQSFGVTHELAILCAGLVGLATLFVPVKFLVVLSQFGTLSIAICILTFIVSAWCMPSHATDSDRVIVGSPRDVLTTLGIICVSFGGCPIIPSIYAQYKREPKDDFNWACCF